MSNDPSSFFRWIADGPMNIPGFGPEKKKNFLAALKAGEEQVLDALRSNMRDWSHVAEGSLGSVVYTPGDENALFDYLKQRYPDEFLLPA